MYAFSAFGLNHESIASKLGFSRESWSPEILDYSKNNFHSDQSEMLRQCLMMMNKNRAEGLQKSNFYHVFHYHVPIKKDQHQSEFFQNIKNVKPNLFLKDTYTNSYFNELNGFRKFEHQNNAHQIYPDSNVMYNENGNDFIQKTKYSDFKNSFKKFMAPAEDDTNKDLNDESSSNY